MDFRSTRLVDLLLLATSCVLKDGDPKVWCRLIGEWAPKQLEGVSTIEVKDDKTEVVGLILGRAKGKYFHIEHVSTAPGWEETDVLEKTFSLFVDRLCPTIKSIQWVIDERDHGLHKFVSRTLRFKAMGVAHHWYAKDHHGIRFQFPIGIQERGGETE